MPSTLTLLTTPEIAKKHKCSEGRIWQIAADRRIKPSQRLGRMALWTPAQAKMLKPVGDRARARGARKGALDRKKASVRKKATRKASRSKARSRRR